MCEQVRDEADDNKVPYLPFLQRLDITIRPGDIEGLSTQIHDSSEHTELRRKAGQNMRLVFVVLSNLFFLFFAFLALIPSRSH